MNYINALQHVPACFAADNSGGQDFDMTRWRKYAAGIHPDLAAKCEEDISGYDFHREVLPVVNDALHHRERLQRLSEIYEKTVRTLQTHLPALFDKEIDLDIILYLGLCSGAGWVTTLDGRDVILLGAEKIVELDWDHENDMKSLIFHEIGHIWHRTYGQMYFPTSSKKETSLLQLYQEGVAMVCEQILCGDDNYYHQDRDGWLSWCMEHEAAIKREFLSRLEQEQSTQDFFGDWCSFEGHSDVGYFLGCQFIKKLREDHTLSEIANMPYDALWPSFIRFAQSDR